jgi:hypothetical protein
VGITGNEDFHHYAVELSTGNIRDLTPHDNVHSRLVPSSISGLHPYEMFFLMNIEDKSDLDVVIYLVQRTMQDLNLLPL